MSHLSKKSLFLICTCLFMLCFSQISAAISGSSANSTTTKLKHLAVTKNDTDAQYLLGYRYETGKTVKRSYKKAINWYKKAALKKHLDAQYRIGLLYFKQKKYTKARYWLAKRAKGGHTESQYYFAKTFRYALGTKEQTTTARKWFTKAAKKGHANAQYELGLLYKDGIGAKKNKRTAIKWLKKSAKQNNKKAKSLLSKIGVKYSPAKSKTNLAKQFMKKHLTLARQGTIASQYELGKAYKLGKKTKINLKKSFYWFKKAANQNHTESQYRLALIYLEGNVAAKKDLKSAKKWLTKAANEDHKKANKKLNELAIIARNEQRETQFNGIIDDATLGDREQQFELGMRYLLGYQTDIDMQQALYWLNKAATQKHPQAQYQLANQYMSGDFVNQDIPLSIHFFSEAAKQKVEKAKYALTHFFENGYEMLVKAEDGDKDSQFQIALSYLKDSQQQVKDKGLKWLQKAANQSHPKALLALGKIYILTNKNTKAFDSFKKAAEFNDADAQFELSLLYKNGVGTPKNQLLAARWLSRAAGQGHEDAQKSLQFSGI